MTNTVITPAEAWEEIERRRISLSPYRDEDTWHATVCEPIVVVGSGDTPLEAIGDLLDWIDKYARDAARKTAKSFGLETEAL
jgi:predicted RNase H-like HicB family nuclease